jgi:Tfp pilus assembly protein FimV
MKIAVALVLLVMGFYIYKQYQKIGELQASLGEMQTTLDAANQRGDKLQKQLDDLKKAGYAPQRPPIPSALSQPSGAGSRPAATPTPGPANWMWGLKTPLDQPGRSK